jgi:hypothetical protein
MGGFVQFFFSPFLPGSNIVDGTTERRTRKANGRMKQSLLSLAVARPCCPHLLHQPSNDCVSPAQNSKLTTPFHPSCKRAPGHGNTIRSLQIARMVWRRCQSPSSRPFHHTNRHFPPPMDKGQTIPPSLPLCPMSMPAHHSRDSQQTNSGACNRRRIIITHLINDHAPSLPLLNAFFCHGRRVATGGTQMPTPVLQCCSAQYSTCSLLLVPQELLPSRAYVAADQ